jgi:hypothetical protein
MKKILIFSLIALFIPQIQGNLQVTSSFTNNKFQMNLDGGSCFTPGELIVEGGNRYVCTAKRINRRNVNYYWKFKKTPSKSDKLVEPKNSKQK